MAKKLKGGPIEGATKRDPRFIAKIAEGAQDVYALKEVVRVMQRFRGYVVHAHTWYEARDYFRRCAVAQGPRSAAVSEAIDAELVRESARAAGQER